MTLDVNYVKQIFNPLSQGDWASFFLNVSDDVRWTVSNPILKTFPVAGVYDKKSLREALAPMNQCFASPLALVVQNIWVVQGQSDTNGAVVELRADAEGKLDKEPFINL